MKNKVIKEEINAIDSAFENVSDQILEVQKSLDETSNRIFELIKTLK